jgi:hypothetical protein
MAVRPSVRFDVFKRDGFSCAYCGRKPPEVTLEVDHIIPIAGGGTDNTENLVTACVDCNRGKGAVPLDREPSAIPSLAERTELIREREEQLRAYHDALAEQADRRDAQLDPVWRYWFAGYHIDSLPSYQTPTESSLIRYIEALGPDEVMDAMDIVHAKFRRPSGNAVRYLFGVLKRKQAQEEGRVKWCKVCGKIIILERDQDISLEYHHAACVDG